MGARRKRLLIGQCACVLLALVAAFLVTSPRDAQAVADAAPGASCATLAAVDQSATSGPAWGKTIFPGHGAPGGWFGVDVCANGFNASIGGAGANVSCSAIPANWSATGCAPGHATRDGYGLSFQCVELIVRFSAWAFGERNGWFGNAPDLWLNGNHPTDFQAIPNGAGRAPVPGDLLVFGSLDSEGRPWPAGPNGLHDGHIAVIAAVRDGQIITAEQNVRWGSQDHPSDVLSLTLAGDHWIVGGTAAPATTLPTYRWPATAGRTRATYGWLHSTHNTGTFPATNAAPSHPASSTPPPAKATPAPPPTPAPAPARPPTPAPSPTPLPTPAPLPALDTQGLTSGVVVTTTGALADLAVLPSPSASSPPASPSGSTSGGASPSPTAATAPATPASPSPTASPSSASPTASPSASPSASSLPQAQARSLGAPAGIWLASDQTPAVVSLPDGERAVFVRGGDGKLYSAVTSPAFPGVRWQALGAPDGTILAGSVSATAFAGGIAVAALASDGDVWWRAGPLGQYGGWLSLGRPAGATLRGIPILGAARGSGDLFALVSAWDGRLYETDTVDALPASGDPARWTPLALPASAAPLNGTLLAIPDLAPTSARPSATIWADVPLNVFTMDGTGTIWWLRGGGQSNGWSIQSFTPPETIQTLLAGVAVADTSSGKAAVALHLYAVDARGIAQTSIVVPSDAAAIAATPQQQQDPIWTVIAPPASTSAPLSLAAIRLAPGLSGLLAADGQRLVLAALPEAQRVLTARMSSLPVLVPASAPATTSTPTSTPASTPAAQTAAPATATATPTAAPVSTPTPAWMTLGAAPLLTTFDDPLLTPQLDPRWTYLGGPGADAHAAPGGMAFAPAAAPARALLLQGTPGRDVAIDAQVTLPASASATARAGLLFYLDDADLLTLSVDRSGSIAFCPTLNGQALTCQRTQLAGHPAAGTPILLRLSQLAGAYSGYASHDGDTWTQVGTWRPDGTAQPNDSSQSAATPAPAATAQAGIPGVPGISQSSPLLFTGMGIFAQDTSAQPTASADAAADAAAWPRVAGFAASVGSAPSQP